MVCSIDGILFGSKYSTYYNVDETWKRAKLQITHKTLLYDSIYMKSPELANL